MLLVYCDDKTSVNYQSKSLKYPIVRDCLNNRACIRFCCFNKSICEDPSNFEVRSLPNATKLDHNYEVLIGKPDCGRMYENDDPWSFSKVS